MTSMSLVKICFFFLCSLVCLDVVSAGMGKAGGLTEVKKANNEIQVYIDLVKQAVEKKVVKDYAEFTAVRYRSQLVDGTNYFVKVKVGPSDYIHVRIFKSLPYAGGEISLAEVQQGKSLDDPIEYF